MIKIIIQRDSSKKIINISAEGHSEYDKEGNDIVCAAISALLQAIEVGLCGYLEEKMKIKKTKAKFLASINRNTPRIKEVDAIIETIVLSIKLIKKKYANFISINEICMN